MQRFFCNHCGRECESIMSSLLHIWTDHFHVDIMLDPGDALILLQNMKPLPLEHGVAVWPDMRVDLKDWRMR